MINLNQEVEIGISPKRHKYYKNLGYNLDALKNENGNIPNGTKIKIKLKYVGKSSQVEIEYICDYCKKIKRKIYVSYNRSRKESITKKDACKDCMVEKRIETNMIKYGGASPNSKYNIEQINKEFQQRGYKLLSTEYIDNSSHLEYICLKHEEHGVQRISYAMFIIGRTCRICYGERCSGENNHNWNGGKTELSIMLREYLKTFNKKSMEICKYQCIFTKQKFTDIHHIYGFSMIIDEVRNKTGKDYKMNKPFTNLTRDEMNFLKDLVIKEHENHIGICLSSKIHSLFHDTFGRGSNTPQQLLEFVHQLKQSKHNDYLMQHNITLNINESILQKLFTHYNIEYNY